MTRKKMMMDGNTAAAHVSYAFTEVAGIYPITPSSNMAEYTDVWASQGRKNIFGQSVKVVEMQSEAGAAGTVHGSLTAGALTTTYTASQGLLLMIPNMYKMAGELLPAVIHVSARALASHALSIFGDHQDVMACRQTGFSFLASTNPQEVMDLGAVAHMAAIEGRVPFLHFFDGFRTSHEIGKIDAWDYSDLNEMVNHGAIDEFRKRALSPENPVLRGSAQNPDIYFQNREACNKFYDNVPAVVEKYMEKVNAKIGTNYKLFNYYGAADADSIIIAMGSVCDTIEETIDYLNAKGEKVGLLKVRLFRPFSVERMLAEIPASVKKIAVLDRTKEPGAIGEPLYLDVCKAYFGKENAPQIVGGRYGLGSKDTTPAQIISVFENLTSTQPKDRFTIGIVDDVTHHSLPLGENPDTTPLGTKSCKFWGLGSDGTVGANKNSIQIIGDNTDMYAQAYFSYDSKKSGGITVSHLRFGEKPIKSTYLINKADFVACHNPSYLQKYEMVEDLKPGGTFLLNCGWDEAELERRVPASVKRYIAENGIKFYTVDGSGIARELGLGFRINMILQAAFFKLANIIPIEDAAAHMKAAVVKSYSKKGEKVVGMNQAAIDRGISEVREISVPDSWKSATEAPAAVDPNLPEFIKEILIPINKQQGHNLPVSTFTGREDGTLEQGSSAYEKRAVAAEVPEWIPENCIQCNFCSYVCPHAVVRPCVMNADEAANAPSELQTVQMNGKGCEDYKFSIIVSTADCMGCQDCVRVCPAKNKALEMKPIGEMFDKGQQKVFDYGVTIGEKPTPFAANTVKGSQFKKPLLQFSGACTGCGETPYAKLVTQLYGDRMLIANATGCSSIWGGSAPSTPYAKNLEGKGPAWANSLFEDTAEFGYGMYLATNQRRERMLIAVREMISADNCAEELKVAGQAWLDVMDDGEKSKVASANLVTACEASGGEQARFVIENKDVLVKKSVWIFGGDGWAYDIGFGGLDHVIASGENVNILIFDTEVYSNTGGQSSKSSQLGSVAQFAASGKPIGKKDLASMAISYGYVYVAKIAMGADYNQTIKAISEAESFPGPSIVIAYAPCIAHGISGGLINAQETEKNAVASGYWNMFRFDPRLRAEGKNPFTLDSKEPTASPREFMMNEVRYSTLFRGFPKKAEELMQLHERQLAEKRKYWEGFVGLYEPGEDN